MSHREARCVSCLPKSDDARQNLALLLLMLKHQIPQWNQWGFYTVLRSAQTCKISGQQSTRVHCRTPIDSTGGSGVYVSGSDGPELALLCVTRLDWSRVVPIARH